MLNFSKISILCSFVGLWLASFFSNSIQLIIGFLFIFSFGILHGANDLLLIQKINGNNSFNSYLKILIYYCLLIAVGIGVFYFIPAVALLLFIIFSGYHFGEQHWHFEVAISKLFQNLFHFTYGSVVLLLLFNSKGEEVSAIIFSITTMMLPVFSLEILLYVFSILLLTLFYFLVKKEIITITKLVLEIFYLVLFALLFKTTELIWGFAIYFVFWHSIPSMIDQIIFINGSVTTANCIEYFKSAFFYWLISLFGIYFFYYLLKDTQLFNAVFFSVLAAITFPHVMVIHKMFDNNK